MPSRSFRSFSLVFWTFFRAKMCCVVCHSYCFCYSATDRARKNVWNTMFDWTLRWFDFRQSENRKNNRKTFEGSSMEPTTRRLWRSSAKIHGMDVVSSLINNQKYNLSSFFICLIFKTCNTTYSGLYLIQWLDRLWALAPTQSVVYM